MQMKKVGVTGRTTNSRHPTRSHPDGQGRQQFRIQIYMQKVGVEVTTKCRKRIGRWVFFKQKIETTSRPPLKGRVAGIKTSFVPQRKKETDINSGT